MKSAGTNESGLSNMRVSDFIKDENVILISPFYR